MPRVIAVCIDENRWIAAAAQIRGERFTIERWLEGSLANGPSIGSDLETAGYGRDPVWIAMGRGRVELRWQRFPALPDEELPMAVRLQAMQQSTTERLLCDFLPMRRDERGVDVLVATCSGEIADGVTKQVAPLKVERLALRPLCSAAWMTQTQATKALSGIFSMKAEQSTTMLIDPRPGEAEYIVFRDKKPAFVRNVRLPELATAKSEVLASEARRSLMASGISDALAGHPPTAVMWGDAKVTERTIAGVQTAIGGTVRLVNPAHAKLDILTPPENADLSAVSAILGLLHAGVSAPDLLIDLQQPRKPPEPPNRTRTYALAGCAAASLFAFLGYMTWRQFAQLETRMTELQKESQFLKRFEEQAKVSQDQLAKVELFTKSNVPWLDRLAEYAESTPPGEDFMVDQITASAGTPENLTLTVSGVVKDPLQLDALEQKLSDLGNKSVREKVNAIENRKPYAVSFQETIRVGIKPRQAPTPPVQPKADEATATTEVRGDAPVTTEAEESKTRDEIKAPTTDKSGDAT